MALHASLSNVLTPPVLSGILHYPLLPRLGLALMGKRGRMTYTCFLQWPSLPVPSMKTGELEASGNQMKGLYQHGHWHFSPLMVPAAEAKIKVMQHVSSDRLPARRERCHFSKHKESASEGWAALHNHINHCLQLIWILQRWICSDMVKKCLFYKQLWTRFTRFTVYTLEKILVPPLTCNNWSTLTLIIQ